MRKLWNLFVKSVVVLTTLFVTSVITSVNTRAFDFSDANTTGYSSASGATRAESGSASSFSLSRTSDSDSFYGIHTTTNSGLLTDLRVNTSSSVPAGSIFTYSVRYMQQNYSGPLEYRGPSLNYAGFTLLSESCYDSTEKIFGSTSFQAVDITCRYVFYNSVSFTSFNFKPNVWFQSPGLRVWVSPISYVTTSGNSVTTGDINRVIQHISVVIDAVDSNTAVVKDIYEKLQQNNGTISGLIEKQEETNNLLEEQNRRDEQDRDNMESQSSDIDSGASDSQADAENTGSTLLTAFSAFVSALSSANPSNCNINMDLGNLDLGVVNFCQLSPPAGFTTLSSIFMILFCVPLSIATGRKVISLFRSFQS